MFESSQHIMHSQLRLLLGNPNAAQRKKSELVGVDGENGGGWEVKSRAESDMDCRLWRTICRLKRDLAQHREEYSKANLVIYTQTLSTFRVIERLKYDSFQYAFKE
jgi:hypothetical protein